MIVDRYLDVQNINNNKIKNGEVMNPAHLFIVTRKSKDESHSMIKLLSIIIPIFIQQTKFQPQ